MNPAPRPRDAFHAALLLAPALLLAGCSRTPARKEPRNLLFITVDTLRADELGAYGATHGVSPNIDALAQTGVVFEKAISQSSWTLPAFASIITSTYPSTHKVDNYNAGLDPSFETLGDVLSDADFFTAAVTSHVFVGPKFGMGQGISMFDDSLVAGNKQAELKVSSPEVTKRGIRWLEDASKRQRRWFLWLHYFDPHFPYLRHDDAGETEGLTEQDYQADIAFTDRWIGQVLEALKRLGVDDDTLVVLVSDHGEEFREHKKLRHGFTLFREVVHVPLIMRAPGVAPGRIGEAVRGIDVMPTVLDLLGLPIPKAAVGRTLVPAMLGQGLGAEPILSELKLHPDYRSDSLQIGRWKLVLDHTGRSTLGYAKVRGGPPTDDAVEPHPPVTELAGKALLFQLDTDPAELHDVAGDHPDVVARMTAMLESMQKRARDATDNKTSAIHHTAEELELLNQLGYSGGQDDR